MSVLEFLHDSREDLTAVLDALSLAHRKAVVRASNLSSPVERVLRASADLIGRSLTTLASLKKPAMLWFGGALLGAVVLLARFQGSPDSAIWADLVSPLLTGATVFCLVPTAALGWRHIRGVHSRWFGSASDRLTMKCRLEIFIGTTGAHPPDRLAGTLVTSTEVRTSTLMPVENVARPGDASVFLMARLPSGELMHLLNTDTLYSETWFRDNGFLTEKSAAYAKFFVDECREAGVLDALSALKREALVYKPEGPAVAHEAGEAQRFSQVKTGTGSNWDSLVLDEKFKGELQMLVEALKNAELLRAQGFEPPTSMLLCGPPGTGKTEVARTLANMAGLAFFAGKGSSLKAGYVGQSAPRVAGLFEKARASAPAIVFVDELDILAGRRDGAPGDNDRLSDEILGELLVELDGVEKAAGDVLFIAATNYPSHIDPALRSRFRQTREVPLPGLEARRAMLTTFLAGKAYEPAAATVLDTIAEATEGFAGRALRNLVDAAAQSAVTRALLEGSADRVVILVDDLQSALDAEHAVRLRSS